MPVCFLDSSALVKRYVRERGSAWVVQVTTPDPQNRIYVVRLTGVEVVSAIARKAKSAGLTPADAAAALGKFQRDFAGGLTIVEISPGLLADAMRLAEKHALRAIDAIQLAGALQAAGFHTASGGHPFSLISADVEMNAAAKAEGLAVNDPNAHP